MYEPLEATLRRLQDERAEADRKYNEALTALDRALAGAPALPFPFPAADDTQLAKLNQTWQLSVPAASGGLKGRIAALVRRAMAPIVAQQTAFNSTLIDHLNRTAARERELVSAMNAAAQSLREYFAASAAFQSHLIQYAQQITPYVDSRDREVGSGALVVNAAVNGLATDATKRWESLAVRAGHVESRISAEEAARNSADAELRTVASAAQQAALAAKREVERLAAGTAAIAAPSAAGSGGDGAVPANTAAFSPSLDAFKYVGFEDEFRGSRDVIRQRLESYVPYFEGCSDVLDVGCGRGEFLELLRAKGIKARGLDLNHEMVELCRSNGHDVAEADVVSYLEALPDASLGGLFAAQVVEHLQPGYLLRFLELAHHKLRPDAPLVLETLNPASWVAFFESYIRDITHVWPLHPETLRYLALASGFQQARIEFRSPVPAADRLQTVVVNPDSPCADLGEAFNANVGKLNQRIYADLDYAIVARNA